MLKPYHIVICLLVTKFTMVSQVNGIELDGELSGDYIFDDTDVTIGASTLVGNTRIFIHGGDLFVVGDIDCGDRNGDDGTNSPGPPNCTTTTNGQHGLNGRNLSIYTAATKFNPVGDIYIEGTIRLSGGNGGNGGVGSGGCPSQPSRSGGNGGAGGTFLIGAFGNVFILGGNSTVYESILVNGGHGGTGSASFVPGGHGGAGGDGGDAGSILISQWYGGPVDAEILVEVYRAFEAKGGVAGAGGNGAGCSSGCSFAPAVGGSGGDGGAGGTITINGKAFTLRGDMNVSGGNGNWGGLSSSNHLGAGGNGSVAGDGGDSGGISIVGYDAYGANYSAGAYFLNGGHGAGGGGGVFGCGPGDGAAGGSGGLGGDLTITINPNDDLAIDNIVVALGGTGGKGGSGADAECFVDGGDGGAGGHAGCGGSMVVTGVDIDVDGLLLNANGGDGGGGGNGAGTADCEQANGGHGGAGGVAGCPGNFVVYGSVVNYENPQTCDGQYFDTCDGENGEDGIDYICDF